MSRYLLDTHVVLWWFTDSDRLSRRARTVLIDDGAEIWLSAASAWEIATKSRIGKLPHLPTVMRDYDGLLIKNGFRQLDITTAHALQAGSLTHAHRDPFNRMIAAQSIAERIPVITTDDALSALGAETLW